MFVPFFTKRASKRELERRKGGGGRGGGSSAGGSRGGSSSSSSGGSSRSSGSVGGGSSGRSSTVSTGSGTRGVSSAGNGGGRVASIPAGQPFAGRSVGGGTRQQVVGSAQYGSGYPGVAGRGVAGRGFPFYFWPVAWGGAAGAGTGAYLHTNEYGRHDNSSRPGGAQVTATFISNSNGTNTFRLMSDTATVTSLIEGIRGNCSSSLAANSSTSSSAFDPNGLPKPEQTVQYYRASSVALTFDGYNNTGALAGEGTPDTPLPAGLDATLLNCLNATIINNVPLVDAADIRWSAPSIALLPLFWIAWFISARL
ncbi:hypothetical protein PC9H_008352 [Pleurotus ostreatus]|uniref:Uncharacterized protein n=2 Tax=Pleurotus ostreatus TaxID=5322 RepID=A0A8H6ZNK3_PLEOS|nr:uncharacterized protein PC9H_008352 [Pleurotus ostreatus]KAF7425990.1 hypothetical protein PC9H_008352 [Pleurotus ostreatus]